jgi:uncharacterized protein involved in exopolysaccharide biosynthesis/Mrp family chromosome partitioning ATPase
VLKAYWIRLMLFAMGGATLALIASSLVDKKYEAVVDLMIDQKAVMPNMPTSEADQSVSDLLDFVRARSLTTQVQALTSFGTIQEACRRVAAQTLAPTPQLGDNSDLDPINVMNSVTVTAEATSDIISLRVRHRKQNLAQAIAQEIYISYVNMNERNTRDLAGRAIDLLRNQATQVNGQLTALDTKMQTLKEGANSADLQTTFTQDVGFVTALKTERDRAAFDMATNEEIMKSIKVQLDKASTVDSAKTKSLNPQWQKLKQDLDQANVDLSQLRTRYTDDREEVKAALQRVALLSTQFKGSPQFLANAQVTEAPNALKNQLLSQYATAQGAYEGAKAKLTVANAKVAEAEERLKHYPELQTQYTNIVRQTASLEKIKLSLDERLKSLEAAKTGRLSVVTEVTAATALPDPVSPKTTINTLFGIAAGLIFGVLSMLATEAKRQPVRSLAQLNALSLKPVYRLVPELRQPYRGLSKAPAEAFDSLLANYLRSSSRPYRVAIVGLVKDSGASTAAINLAIAGSRHGARVLLVQCDPRGGMSRMSGKQPPAEGEVIDISPLVKGTSAESILTLSGDRNPEITSTIRENEADLTVIDLEPTTKSAEYAFLAPHIDEVILLVRAGRSKSVEFLQAQQALKEAGCKQVTVAFTRSSDLAVVTESVDPELDAQPTAPKSLEE